MLLTVSESVLKSRKFQDQYFICNLRECEDSSILTFEQMYLVQVLPPFKSRLFKTIEKEGFDFQKKSKASPCNVGDESGAPGAAGEKRLVRERA